MQGSNGEAQHLSHEERIQTITLTRQTLDENGFKHVVVMAGCGAPSVKESKKLCADAKDAGAGFVLVLTPSVWLKRMTKDAILAYHREVCSTPTCQANLTERSSPGCNPFAPALSGLQLSWRNRGNKSRVGYHSGAFRASQHRRHEAFLR